MDVGINMPAQSVTLHSVVRLYQQILTEGSGLYPLVDGVCVSVTSG